MSKNKYEEFDDEFEVDDDDEGTSVDWTDLFQKLYARKKLFIITTIITCIIVVPLVLTVPKYYLVTVKLAPELSNSATKKTSSSLSSLLSSFGLGGSDISDDAIGPLLYPDLMNSKTFLVSLFDVPVVSKDGKIKTSYYNYLHDYQKKPVWEQIMDAVHDMLPEEEEDINATGKAPNPSALTKDQDGIAKTIKEKVTCEVDKKTGVITISVKDQDPYICAAVASYACNRLQEFITEYRTKKARQEMINMERQYNQSKAEYEAAKQRVEGFNDSNWDLVDEDLMVQKQDLSNKMQLAFQTMTAFSSQLINARTKYESLRPVYTVLDGASIPLKPEGPKRSLIMLGLLIFVLMVEAGYVLLGSKVKDEVAAIKNPSKPEE